MLVSRRRATPGCRSVLLVIAVLLGGSAHAQSNSAALDLLFPIGARSTAMGAAFATERGSEAIWHNPAGIARLTKAEFGIDHFSTFQLENAAAVSLAFPV